MPTKILIDTDAPIVGFCLGTVTESVAMDNKQEPEKELIDTFERIVHQDFPNPRRVGCPGRQALLEFALHPANTNLSPLLAHIRQCAPCFDELKELRKKQINGNVRRW